MNQKKGVWKKYLTWFLAGAMILSVTAGCNSQPTSNSSSNGESNPTSSAATNGEKQVLSFMAVGGSSEQAFVDTVTAAAERFNESNEYNAEIQLEWYENEQYKTKLATLMTQNDVTDVFFTWEAGFMKDYVDSGRVYSISEALEADPEWKDSFNEGAFNAVTFDGKIYAMPMGQAVVPVYYNKQIFEECKIQLPETWDEFLAMVATIKAANYVPIAMGAQDAWVPGQFMVELSGGVGGSDLFQGAVDGTVRWDDERYIETGKLFQELVNNGAFPEGFLGLSGDEGRALFTDGKAAMYPMGTWDTYAVIDGIGDAEDIGVFFIPAYNPDFNDVHISSVEKLFAISETCENKDAAIDFLKSLSSKETQEQYLLDCGGLPATKIEVDESKVDPVTLDIMELQKGLTKLPLTFMDRQFGANVGGEFNNISLAIAGGKDPAEQFSALQAYAEQEAGQ